LIEPKISGILFKPESHEDLAIKLGSLLSNEEMMHKIQKTSREYVTENYNWADLVKKYLSIYNNLLDY